METNAENVSQSRWALELPELAVIGNSTIREKLICHASNMILSKNFVLRTYNNNMYVPEML
jgi:hypothetical protein